MTCRSDVSKGVSKLLVDVTCRSHGSKWRVEMMCRGDVSRWRVEVTCWSDGFLWHSRICVEFKDFLGWEGVTLVWKWRVEITTVSKLGVLFLTWTGMTRKMTVRPFQLSPPKTVGLFYFLKKFYLEILILIKLLKFQTGFGRCLWEWPNCES